MAEYRRVCVMRGLSMGVFVSGCLRIRMASATCLLESMECACIPLGDGALDDAAGLLGECNAPARQRFVAVDGGDGFTVALNADGAVFGWGRGFYGELPVGADRTGGGDTPVAGNDSRIKRIETKHGSFTLPMRLQVPVTCMRVACGANHVLALSSTRHVLGWGWNLSGQAGQSVEVIAAGGMHSLAIDARGRVWSWGQNVYGQLGVNSDDDNRNSTPKLVILSPDVKALHVAAGWAHSALVSSTGEVLTFGWGLYHQLGHGVAQDEPRPTVVAALRGLDSGIEQVACGNWHTAVRTASGDLYTWGWGPDGQLGHGSTVVTQALPRVVTVHSHATESQDALALACGPRHTLALCRDGSIQCWGPAPSPHALLELSSGPTDGVGRGSRRTPPSSEMRLRDSKQHVHQLAVGHSHAVLLLEDEESGGGG